MTTMERRLRPARGPDVRPSPPPHDHRAGEASERVRCGFVGGCELDEAEVWVARRRGLQVVQDEAPDLRMLDGLGAELLGAPRAAATGAELLLASLERVDQRREVGVADAARLLGAEARERASGGARRCSSRSLTRREEPPQEVLSSVGRARRLAEHRRRGGVPREDVGARTEQVGRVRCHRSTKSARSGGASRG